MKHFEVLRKWCKKIEIEIFVKWLISLDHVTYKDPGVLGQFLYLWACNMLQIYGYETEISEVK